MRLSDDDRDYVEVDAVVRMPAGERLADSRKTEGWSRGFTPNSTDKGPEHVEIRLKAEGEDDQSEPEPVVVYIHESGQLPQPTVGEMLAAAFVNRVLDELVEVARPHVVQWRDTKLIPALKAKRDDLIQKREARKAKKASRAEAKPATLVVEDVGTNDAPGHDVATKLHDLRLTMTTEQYEQLVVALLATEEFRSRLLHVLANAHVAGGDPAALELRELPPQELSAGVTELVFENPAILEDLGRHLMDRGPVELVEPVRRSG
jgi:hypothetical protein